MLVPPGEYRVALLAGGRELVKPLSVVADPRVPIDAAGLREAMALSRDVANALSRHAQLDRDVRELKKKLGAAIDAKLAPLLTRGGDESTNLDSIGGALVDLQIDLEGSDRAPTRAQRDVLAMQSARLEKALKWFSENSSMNH